jgi:tetratricopeptide (TPR) repeat protein
VNPADGAAYEGRARLEQELGDLTAALADCNALVRLQPSSAFPYLRRGGVRSLMHDRAGALADYKAALKIYRAQGQSTQAKQVQTIIDSL